MLAGDDFDLLAGLQAVVEGHDAPVDLGAAAVVADFGVHAVGEVQRRGTLGQVDGMAVRGEHVDPVRLDVDPQLLGQATDVAQLFVPLQHLAQPGNLLFVMVGTGLDVGALVAPVGANTQLGFLVHAVGTDLHFQHLALGADHRGVQRAIAVLLGVGDVVVELLGDMPPQGVHDAQRGVAVADFRHQHAYRAHIVDLAEFQAFALHLAPDRIDMFRPAADVGLDASGQQLVLQLVHHLADEALAVQPALVQQLGNLFVLIGLKVAEGQVFQLPLDVADTQAVGQWRIDVEHFARDAQAFLVVGGLDRSDRAGALGQLDQRHAHVVDHGHEHLAQVLDLRLRTQHQRLARAEAGADRSHAQHTVDQLGHHRAEALADLGQGHLALAHRAVDDRRHQGILVELEVGEDFGDLQARLEAGRTVRPGMLGRVALFLDFMGKLAGLFQRCAIQCRIDAYHMVQPCFEIDTAVGIDRLVHSHLYHLCFTFPYSAPRGCAGDHRAATLP